MEPFFQKRLFFQKVLIPSLDADLGQLEWQSYESYMQAVVLEEFPSHARLLVRFPPETSENNRLHSHPCSDRVVTAIRGEGEFIYLDGEREVRRKLVPGDRVWMPRGTIHTFRSGASGLLVESIHSPFVPLDSPECIVEFAAR